MLGLQFLVNIGILSAARMGAFIFISNGNNKNMRALSTLYSHSTVRVILTRTSLVILFFLASALTYKKRHSPKNMSQILKFPYWSDLFAYSCKRTFAYHIFLHIVVKGLVHITWMKAPFYFFHFPNGKGLIYESS